MERILCAAIRLLEKDTTIGCCRHLDGIEILHNLISNVYVTQEMQGFLTNKNRFVSRREAYEIAVAAQQLIIEESQQCRILYSEDLY